MPEQTDRKWVSGPEPDLEMFLQLESRVWAALQTGDGDLDRSMLSEDFLGVYPSGFSDRDGHVEQLSDGPTVAEYRLSEARLFVINDDEVLLSYRADWQRPDPLGLQPAPEAMYVSSLWSRRDGRWINTFSQDTPTD